MNFLRVIALFTAIFCNCEVSSHGISSLDDETYQIFVELIKGEFHVPLKERSSQVKSALVRFWRNQKHLSLRQNQLCFDGKVILKKSDVGETVKKAYKETKGSGVRKLYHHMKGSCSGIGERDVRSVLQNCRVHQRLNARFQNHAPLKPIRARSVQIRHQVDLISMEKSPCRHKGKTFKYILSVIDVFSRYHWLVPLQRKASEGVAKALCDIYREHGPPKVIQHDCGTEFRGAVERLCKTLKIKVIQSRPYHPQSQGKIERSHRVYKKKLLYDMLTVGKSGVSWVRSLQDYARTMNVEPREELKWKSAFEVYYGRKINKERYNPNNLLIEERSTNADMTLPRSKDYKAHKKDTSVIRKIASEAGKKCEKRMIRKGLRKNPVSIYSVGESVLIRYPPSKKISSKRSIIEARILGRNLKNHIYKVRFVFPVGGSNVVKKWISVTDITSLTAAEEKKKRKQAEIKSKKQHRKQYLIPLLDPREVFGSILSRQRLTVRFDPDKDGNCQFSALCYHLAKIGIYRSPETLRKELVEYLMNHPSGADGFPLELFIGMPWEQYLAAMSNDGVFGDHLTLQAAANVFMIQINVYSSLGPSATQVIAPMQGCPLATFSLGHFAEGAGEHYVCLEDNAPQEFQRDDQTDSENEDERGNEVDEHENAPQEPLTDDQADGEQESGNERVKHGHTNKINQNHTSSTKNQNQLTKENDNKGGPHLNYDILEQIIKIAVQKYPSMRSSLRMVSRFFRDRVNKVPLPEIHIPELDTFADIHHVSIRRIIRLKGRGSAVISILRKMIDSVNWANAWVSFVFHGLGWYGIKSIYWKKRG